MRCSKWFMRRIERKTSHVPSTTRPRFRSNSGASRHHLLHAVIARGRDERAQDRQRQSEDGDTGAQGRQRSSFLSEEHLDFAKDEIVQLGWLVRFHIHMLFNLTTSDRDCRCCVSEWSNRKPLTID